MTADLVLRHLEKRFPNGTVAVAGIDLEVGAGELVALLGPSGCGKTTTLRMVAGFEDPSAGTIELGGKRIDVLPPDRRGATMVFQGYALFPHLSVFENVGYGLRVRRVGGQALRDKVHAALGLVGLEGLGDRRPQQLSGGQQQRVGVARALAADPPVMLMDEPFSAVDPIVREQLQDEFLRLQGDLGKTIVFVTHDIEEAIKLGDQVAVLRVGGQLAQLADPAYLLAHPVDDFVADFVGRDRGYRALSFQPSPRFPLAHEQTVQLGATPVQAAAAARDGWVLVIDVDRRPLGWIEPGQITVPIQPEMLHRGGTVAKEGGPLRNTLDAALSSPSRRGVIVDDQGAILGTVRAHEVLAEIEERSRPALEPDSPQDGGHGQESLQPVEEEPA